MRIGQIVPGIAGFALMIVSTQAAFAQDIAVVSKSGGGSAAAALVGGGTGVLASGLSEPEAQNRTIEPYTANRKTTRVQKLANGTTITQESIAKEARDSSGRTYRESRTEVPLGAEARAPGFSFVNVVDPVNRIAISWSSNSKEATEFHIPEPGQTRPVPPATAAVQPGAVPAPTVRFDRPKPQVEDLGTRTIGGLEASGARTTRVIPAGQAGNDQPLTVIHETWMSPELMEVVLQIDDDPRTGVRTTELTDIERGNPDPGLFQVPAGYTVKERPPGQQD